MIDRKILCLLLAVAPLAVAPLALAQEDPQHERHELMEDVGKAAKPIGKMLKGEMAFDGQVVQSSLLTFQDAASVFGSLFPPGSDSGDETEAAPAIWEDRAGFEAALSDFRAAVDAALLASPQSLDEAKPVVGTVFRACKGCHDTYRLDKD